MDSITSEPKSPDTVRTSWKKYVIILILCGGLGTAMWAVWHASRGPSEGVILKKESSYDLNHPDLPPENISFAGRYGTFSLPASYTEKIHETTKHDDGSVERAFLTDGSVGGNTLALTVSMIPSGDVTTLSAYQFRMIRANGYVHTSLQKGEISLPVFQKQDSPYEVTGFLSHGNFVASISLTSVSNAPEKLMRDFSLVANSFQWTSGMSSR